MALIQISQKRLLPLLQFIITLHTFTLVKNTAIQRTYGNVEVQHLSPRINS